MSILNKGIFCFDMMIADTFISVLEINSTLLKTFLMLLSL